VSHSYLGDFIFSKFVLVMLMHLNTEELALSLVISIVLPISGNEKSLDLKAT